MIFGNDRDALRRFYCEVWARRLCGEALDRLAAQVAAVIEEHPEYQPLLADAGQALATEYTPEMGRTNPFLHMGMHLALREQAATDRPTGILAIHQRLAGRLGPHEAEHRMMDCLGEAIWQAQRSGRTPDEDAYLDCLRSLAGRWR